MTYDVKCPSCGLLHTLQEDDLGAQLTCAQCDGRWVFDGPLRERKAEAKAAKKAERRRKQEQVVAAKEKARQDRIKRERGLPPVATPIAPPVASVRSIGIKHFHVKIVGISHRNDDGTDRQIIAGKCCLGEWIGFAPDEDNPYDENAVRVCRKDGEQLGFLSAHCAADVSPNIRDGYKYAVFVSDLLGGTNTAPTRGIRIIVFEAQPGVSWERLEDYVSRVGVPGRHDEAATEVEHGVDTAAGSHALVYLGLVAGALALLLIWLMF